MFVRSVSRDLLVLYSRCQTKTLPTGSGFMMELIPMSQPVSRQCWPGTVRCMKECVARAESDMEDLAPFRSLQRIGRTTLDFGCGTDWWRPRKSMIRTGC